MPSLTGNEYDALCNLVPAHLLFAMFAPVLSPAILLTHLDLRFQ